MDEPVYEVKLRWWIYVYKAILFFSCRVFGISPNVDRICWWIGQAMYIGRKK